MEQNASPTNRTTNDRYPLATDLMRELLELDRSRAQAAMENEPASLSSSSHRAAPDASTPLGASDQSAMDDVERAAISTPVFNSAPVASEPSASALPPSVVPEAAPQVSAVETAPVVLSGPPEPPPTLTPPASNLETAESAPSPVQVPTPLSTLETTSGKLQIGRLRKAPVKELLGDDAGRFVQWLQNNLDLLNDALGVSLFLTEAERRALLTVTSDEPTCVAAAGSTPPGNVIVECQLTENSHEALGRLIASVSAVDPAAAVWIVVQTFPEQVRIVSWLNRSLKTRFYLLKLEAVRIDGSLPAPILTLVTGPDAAGV